MKPRLLVLSYYDPAATDEAMRGLRERVEIVRVTGKNLSNRDTLTSTLAGFPIAIISGEQCDNAVFSNLPDLKLLACDGVGVDHVDLAAATSHGVAVINAPVVHEANADFVFGLIIALSRKLLIADNAVRQGLWNDRERYLSRDVHGATLGLMGFGRVAQAVARRARGFDMTVLAYSPHASTQRAAELGVTIVSKAELLRRSDFLSAHVPLNASTRGLLGAAEFGAMKPGAFFINSSRGAVLDEAALIDVLRSGHLAGAALDVLTEEPPSQDHPLLAMPNVILSPHMGSDTVGTHAKVFRCLADDILRFLNGDTPINLVNRDVLASLPR
jgi:glyoxylate reductase